MVDVFNSRTLSNQFVSWPYKKSFGQALPLQQLLKAFFAVLKKQFSFPENEELTGYVPCQTDEADVMLVTCPRVSGVLKMTQAFCMEPSPLHTLFLTFSRRLPPENACFIGLSYYPNALSHHPGFREQGPFSSVDEPIAWRHVLKKVLMWVIQIPKPPRHVDGTDL
eukprot:8611550-Karenia_brevis.AAC.2